MELSRYIVSVPDCPTVGNTLIFNLFRGKAISIPSKKYLEINALQENEPQWISNQSKDVLFLRDNFLVESSENERLKILESLDSMTQSKRCISIAILTTTDCNMACPYCHEGLQKKKLYMSKAMAEDVADFIMNYLVSSQTRELWLYYYGGEPLLNLPPIEALLSRLQEYELISSGKIRITQDMSTNGILLDRPLAHKLNKIGLHTAQITLDGPPEIHNERRILRSGKGSFYEIVENIKNTMDLLAITIRINIDKQNWNSVPYLIDILINEGLKERIHVYADFVTDTFEKSAYCSENVVTDQKEKRKLVEIWRDLDRYGFPLPGLKFTEGMCGNLGTTSIVIDPLGDIFRCIGFVGNDEYVIGNIKSTLESKADFKTIPCRPYIACIDCTYLPVCGGGCRVQALLQTGNIMGISCNKDFFDYAYPEFLRLKFKNLAKWRHDA